MHALPRVGAGQDGGMGEVQVFTDAACLDLSRRLRNSTRSWPVEMVALPANGIESAAPILQLTQKQLLRSSPPRSILNRKNWAFGLLLFRCS